LKDTLRQLGPALTFMYGMHQALLRTTSGRCRIVPYSLYAQPLGSAAYTAVRDDADTQVAEVLPGDPLISAFPRPAQVLAERWRGGSRCLAATVKGAFAGHIWISRGQHAEDEVRCRYLLPDHSVWDFDVYVEPRLRLGRTLGRMWKAVDHRLRAEGAQWSFSRISRFNPGSIAVHERLGAKRVGVATFIVLGPLQIACFSQRPYLWASAGNGAGPRITLRLPADADRAG
jgi:hypothetical protein